MKNVPNIISVVRLLLAIIFLFIAPYSTSFYIVYILCGFSDVMDGYLARRFNVTSKYGAVLDSIADMTFVLILFIKLIPVIRLPKILIVSILIISIIRITSIIIGFIRYKKLVMLHTYGNKVTGLIIFIGVLFYKCTIANVMFYIICLIAALASIEDLIINITSKKIDLNIKSLLRRK